MLMHYVNICAFNLQTAIPLSMKNYFRTCNIEHCMVERAEMQVTCLSEIMGSEKVIFHKQN